MPVTPYRGMPVTAVVVVDRREGDGPKFGFYVTSQHTNITSGGAGYDENGLVGALRRLRETYVARVELKTLPDASADSTLRWLVKDPSPVRGKKLDVIDAMVNA